MDFINAILVLLNYTVIPALTYGSQLALGAIFVTLIYGILRFANFATGDMMSFGTMFAVLLTYYFQSKGISFGLNKFGKSAPYKNIFKQKMNFQKINNFCKFFNFS